MVSEQEVPEELRWKYRVHLENILDDTKLLMDYANERDWSIEEAMVKIWKRLEEVKAKSKG